RPRSPFVEPSAGRLVAAKVFLVGFPIHGDLPPAPPRHDTKPSESTARGRPCPLCLYYGSDKSAANFSERLKRNFREPCFGELLRIYHLRRWVNRGLRKCVGLGRVASYPC